MKHKLLTIIGDSISLGYGLDADEPSYVDMIADLNEYEIILKAKNGNDLNSIMLYINEINERSDACIVFIGTNGTLTKGIFLLLIKHLKTITNKIILCNLAIKSENNQIIRDVALSEHISLCNLNEDMVNNKSLFLKDSVHPNRSGHETIYLKLLKYLR